MADTVFDNIFELPSKEIQERSATLIGFDAKLKRTQGNLKLLLDVEGLEKWVKRHHPKGLGIVTHITDRHPLIIFEGDVGTGKTVTAEGIADSVTRDLGKSGFLLRLSTRVRGEGLHGEMGNLVNDAFDKLKTEAGKKRLAFLLIDEADAIATTRGTQQMHQEEKAGVNTLIQKIDEIRELKGRAIVIMSTNRLYLLDEAIVRRAAVVVKFKRPNEEERKELIEKDLNGVGLNEKQIKELVELTGSKEGKPGYSFSDLRLRVFPEALAYAYPDQPLTYDILKKTLVEIDPSPEIAK